MCPIGAERQGSGSRISLPGCEPAKAMHDRQILTVLPKFSIVYTQLK